MKSGLDGLKVETFSSYGKRKSSLGINRNMIFIVRISQMRLLIASLLFPCNDLFLFNVNFISLNILCPLLDPQSLV